MNRQTARIMAATPEAGKAAEGLPKLDHLSDNAYLVNETTRISDGLGRPKQDARKSTLFVLVGCSKTKLNSPAPARELYRGNLFRLASRWAELKGHRWGVLSALHGFIEPDTVVEPYDLALADVARRGQLDAWNNRVTRQLHRHLPDDVTGVVILAGRAYAGFGLAPRGGRFLAKHAPLEGLGIGRRLRALSAACARLEGEVVS